MAESSLPPPALILHPSARGEGASGPPEGTLDAVEGAAARAEIRRWPGYAPTPLRSLPGLGARLALGSLRIKDESGRFGLGSFKALGGAYAVYRLLAARVAEALGVESVEAAALAGGEYRAITEGCTVCCATDGNHGRSVAWGAQTFGCGCVIYLHEGVSPGREAAIARYGAAMVRTPGGYDESVRQAARDAEANGWTVVSDTTWEGYEAIPRDVMHGYTLMAEEAFAAYPPDAPPTHVIIQAGVGGVAAAVAAQAWWRYREARPRLVVVEPERAACLYASARAGRAVTLEGDVDTFMACLSAGEPSPLAWRVLDATADAFLAIADGWAPEAMRLLAAGVDGDPEVVSGESGAAGVAALLAMAAAPEQRAALLLDSEARVLVFSTEGSTDPEIWRSVVGRAPGPV